MLPFFIKKTCKKTKNKYIYTNIFKNKSMNIFKRIILSVFLLVISFDLVNANLSISPIKHELSIEENSSQSEIIKIKNSGNSTITLYSSIEDFIAGDDSWTPKFVKKEDMQNPSLSLTNWIEIENETITLAPNETKEIRFNVNIPNWAEPGWHYWAIFFSPWVPSDTQVAVVQRIWVLVLIDVPWEVVVDWDFESLKVWKSVANFEEANSFRDFPIVFSWGFENKWNTHLKPTWKIELFDESWDLFKQVWKEAIVSRQGAVIWYKVVDYIPLNEWWWNTLPSSKRNYKSTWEWFWKNVIDDVTWEKDVEFKWLKEYYADKIAENSWFVQFYEKVKVRSVKKPITANYYVSYEGKDNNKKEFRDSIEFFVEYDETYIWYNTVLIIILILILAWAGYYFAIIAPKNKEKAEEALRKKIMEEVNNNK